MASGGAAVRSVRQLLAEVRRSSRGKKIKDLLVTRYIMSECRKYQFTGEQVCKAKEEMKHLAETYLCYLRSKRVYEEINKEYAGRGERSIEDTAKLVGFKLPHDPK